MEVTWLVKMVVGVLVVVVMMVMVTWLVKMVVVVLVEVAMMMMVT